MKIKAGDLIFQCDNAVTEMRARSLFTKEPGTIEWLSEVRPGDVFWDIGANVGCYSMLAAKSGATVIAFEPHLQTAVLLQHNIRMNGLEKRISIITSPLDSYTGLSYFSESTPKPGSSGHGIGAPEAGDLRCSESPDHYLSHVDGPSMIKIDVDGNELRILWGAGAALRSSRLRSVQVEMPVETADEIRKYMSEKGFTKSHDHYTAAGHRAISAGADPHSIVYNTVFRRA